MTFARPLGSWPERPLPPATERRQPEPATCKPNWQRSRLIFPMELPIDRSADAVAAVVAQERDAVLILELTARAGQITHHVLADVPAASFVNRTLRSHLPGLRIEGEELDRPSFTHRLELKLSNHERPNAYRRRGCGCHRCPE